MLTFFPVSFSILLFSWANFNCSSMSATFLVSLASCAVVKIPLSPVSVAIPTAASIINTMIVLIFRYDYFLV